MCPCSPSVMNERHWPWSASLKIGISLCYLGPEHFTFYALDLLHHWNIQLFLIVCVFFITTETINMFPECCESEMCFFPHQVKMCKRLSKQWGGAPVLVDKITTSNVVPCFRLMGLFLHRQSFSPWGICSLSIKSFATVPHYNLSIWSKLRNECQAL